MVNDVAKWGHIYMKENFDLNVCYRKVFEILSTECNMQKVINSIADYAEVSFLVVDIGGKVLAASDKKLDIGCLSEQEIAYKESMIKIISKCIECQNKNEQKTSTYIEDDGEYKVVNSIEVKGNTEGFCIEMISSDAEMSEDEKEMICQVNDITCQALGMVLERYGTQVHYHSSTLRRMIARSLFEGETEERLRLKGMQEMYDAYVKAPFIVATLELKKDSMIQLQKAGNQIMDVYHNSFVYIKERTLCVLFCDIHLEETEGIIRHILDEICEKYDMLCGFSDVFEKSELIDKKSFMALRALEIGRKVEPDKRLYMEYDYYIQIVCSCAAPYIGKARYLEDELLQLKYEDEAKGTEFYNTLKEYLLHGNNVSMTSKKLYIHRNTMIYRLGKINEILDVDINDPVVSRRLMLSIMLQEQSM